MRRAAIRQWATETAATAQQAGLEFSDVVARTVTKNIVCPFTDGDAAAETFAQATLITACHNLHGRAQPPAPAPVAGGAAGLVQAGAAHGLPAAAAPEPSPEEAARRMATVLLGAASQIFHQHINDYAYIDPQSYAWMQVFVRCDMLRSDFRLDVDNPDFISLMVQFFLFGPVPYDPADMLPFPARTTVTFSPVDMNSFHGNAETLRAKLATVVASLRTSIQKVVRAQGVNFGSLKKGVSELKRLLDVVVAHVEARLQDPMSQLYAQTMARIQAVGGATFAVPGALAVLGDYAFALEELAARADDIFAESGGDAVAAIAAADALSYMQDELRRLYIEGDPARSGLRGRFSITSLAFTRRRDEIRSARQAAARMRAEQAANRPQLAAPPSTTAAAGTLTGATARRTAAAPAAGATETKKRSAATGDTRSATTRTTGDERPAKRRAGTPGRKVRADGNTFFAGDGTVIYVENPARKLSRPVWKAMEANDAFTLAHEYAQADLRSLYQHRDFMTLCRNFVCTGECKSGEKCKFFHFCPTCLDSSKKLQACVHPMCRA
jgi:hypothetical protein